MSSSETNSAAWLEAMGKPFVVREAPMPPAPASQEVVVRIHAVAINPIDAYRQARGIYTPSYPYILGFDAAGDVVSCGDEVSDVKPGDKIIALSDDLVAHSSSHGFFQRFAVVGDRPLCKIPSELSYEDACVLPMGVNTAAGMLFENVTLDLEWPTTDEKERAKRHHSGEVVVVWGASSSVGCNAVQLLKAAGYRAVATAGKHNFDLVKECGADAVVDHTATDAVDQVCKWVEEQNLQSAGVTAMIINEEVLQKCAQVAQRLPGKKFVSTSLPRGVRPEPDLGEGITTSNCYGLSQPDLHKYIWKEWMPKALELGQLKCLPRPEVVGQGLEAINHACELILKGVSGKKLVVGGI
ncbi:hypothetical protein PMZ80_005809 [Knufia obscura]|uniref:Enoyl reductase (ER) domain-containing protein n=1 Tax=Knufia obscura TaxID=1635080 RepID=A0ABR0RNQ5_9EURO|nr:hypothetical protein PMZ80_005809 [Knufia obscura]